jgi:hypothetical protein
MGVNERVGTGVSGAPAVALAEEAVPQIFVIFI